MQRYDFFLIFVDKNDFEFDARKNTCLRDFLQSMKILVIFFVQSQ